MTIVLYSGFNFFSDMVEDMKDEVEGTNTSMGNTSKIFDGPFEVLADIMPFFWFAMILFMIGNMWFRFGGCRY